MTAKMTTIDDVEVAVQASFEINAADLGASEDKGDEKKVQYIDEGQVVELKPVDARGCF